MAALEHSCTARSSFKAGFPATVDRLHLHPLAQELFRCFFNNKKKKKNAEEECIMCDLEQGFLNIFVPWNPCQSDGNDWSLLKMHILCSKFKICLFTWPQFTIRILEQRDSPLPGDFVLKGRQCFAISVTHKLTMCSTLYYLQFTIFGYNLVKDWSTVPNIVIN